MPDETPVISAVRFEICIHALLLILFTKSLDICFAVRIEEFLAALLPRRFEFSRRNVPVGTAFLKNVTEILAEIFNRRPAEEPVAHVNLIYDEAGLEDDRVWDHRIVAGVCVLRDIEILLNDAPRIGQERPVSADSAAKFIGLSDIVGADRDQSAISNFHLTMELNETFVLAPIFGTEAPAAENDNHWILSLQFGSLRRLPA
jgi:hypothetical protein